jgi:transcriptional regulator GlxA family with amidase domain
MEVPSQDATEIPHAEIIHRAQRHIVEHAAKIIDFAELAESLGVPYRTLRYLFAKEAGTSPLQYQLDIRLARAKNLLRSSDMPISEIATALGFRSGWYFAHFFQKRMKISAAAYRKGAKTIPKKTFLRMGRYDRISP